MLTRIAFEDCNSDNKWVENYPWEFTGIYVKSREMSWMESKYSGCAQAVLTLYMQIETNLLLYHKKKIIKPEMKKSTV